MSDHFNAFPWCENILSKIAIAVPASIYSFAERVDGSIAFTYISPYAQEIHEVTVEAVMANANLIFEQIHPDDLAGYIAAVETSKVNLQPFRHEFRIITPSGKLKWIQANSRPERLPNQATVWYGMALDITIQKESELALARVNDELREQSIKLKQSQQETEKAQQELLKLGETALQLTENIPVGTYVMKVKTDGSPQFTFISDRWLKMANLRREDVIADPYIAFRCVHPDEYDAFIALNLEVIEKGLPFYWEGRVIVNGEIRWYSAESNPRVLSDGSYAWEGVMIDISDRIKTEQRLIQINNELEQQISLRTIELKEREANYLALRESEEKFHLSFDNANIGMCLVDLQGNLLQVNPTMCQIFGYSQDELIGMNVATLALPEDDQVSSKFIQGAVDEHRDSNVFEKRYRHRQGHIIYGEISSSLVRDANGNPLYFISHVQDITDRKMHERELQKAHDAIAQSNIELEERVSQRTADLQAKETALRKSERIFRSYFEQSLIGMAMTSPSKGWLNVNDKLCEILGYSFVELQELTWDKMTAHVGK